MWFPSWCFIEEEVESEGEYNVILGVRKHHTSASKRGFLTLSPALLPSSDALHAPSQTRVMDVGIGVKSKGSEGVQKAPFASSQLLLTGRSPP